MRSKTRLIAAVASLLVCLAMVGTGFASWVILQDQSVKSEGNVRAEAVTDSRVSLTVDPTSGAEIFYGSPATMNEDNAWLIETESEGQAKLELTFTLKIKGDVKSFGFQFTTTGEWDTLKDAGFFADPQYEISNVTGDANLLTTPTSSDEQTQITLAGTTFKFTKHGDSAQDAYNFTNETTITLKATFGWNTKFNSQNPYNYFNSKTISDTATGWDAGKYGVPATNSGTGEAGAITWGDVAKGVLGYLETELESTTYTFIFTAKSAGSKA